MKRIFLSLSFVTIGFTTFAQNTMVKDISVGSDPSSPTRLTVFGKQLVFFANDQVAGYGNELFAMDSAGNIAMAYNINAGLASSGNSINYVGMAVIKNNIYFPANDGTHGIELYTWDGTNPPMMVIDLNPGSASSNVNEVIAYQDKIYFTASTSTTGVELWVHDPIKNTTELIRDFAPGNISGNPTNLTLYNNRLFFVASDNVAGRELYAYDAVTDSANMVKDINPGAAGSDPQSLVVGNSRLYFSATDAVYGRELFCLFDTTITLLADIYPGINGGIFSTAGANRIGILNGMVYIGASDGVSGTELYKYDHKTKKVSLVYKINPLGSSTPTSFIKFSNKIYFTANDGVHGNELWSYDGKGTPEMVVDIDTAGSASSNPMNFLIHNDGLFFSARESEFGTELYVYRDPAVGVQKISFDADVKVYPNPTSTFTNIELKLNKNESLNVRVTDITGKEVYNTGIKSFNAGNNTITVPMHSLTTGMYFYTINNGLGNIYVRGKITKE